ncbi:LOW QUALITY PROTEIN: mucin-2-like [Uloborus diversus]|uniref:LOW QUALITY PROTEIN: mucin-2-like n=1 Tax=Uloborus diversus TaxID=327109 RepID=UPI00240A2C57|nr:LOW QUALITY PROTEIN: mucin-2-like [Uloborus diversus]
MDDGGRCLLDVINDPLLLQSFLESGSDENSKDPQDGTSSESAVESPQVPRSSHSTFSNHQASIEHIVEQSEMGYSYTVEGQAVLAQSGICSTNAGLGSMSLLVTSSGQQTYQHASSSGATIHHIPSSAAHTTLHPHSPASARPATPLSHNIKSPGQGPSSVHSMPPPSPLQQTRSPLPSHTPSPAPAWSPIPPVLSPATSRTQSSMPSVAFQQSHNQMLQTSSVTQFVTALANQQSITQKLNLQQQQQQLFLQQQQQILSPVSQPAAPRLTAVTSPIVSSAAVTVPPPMVQLITAPQSNVSLPTRTSHSAVRPIQPKIPPQILPKPATCTASNQFVSPAPTPKQPPPPPVTANQRTVGVGIQPSATGQLVIGQGQPGVFSGPQGTIVLNQIIPGVGQNPILIQGMGNLANIPGLQLTLRPPSSASPGQSVNSSNSQNNATLIAALQGPSQHAQTLFAPAKSPIHGQQTVVIPNNLAHPVLASQNINLTSSGIPNSGIMSSSSQGQGFLTRSNIILSPRVVGGNQGLQLQQIQTPQGPIFAFAPSQTIAVPHLQTALQNATLGNAQLAPVTLPMHGIMTNQGVLSGLSLQSHAPQSALQQQQQSLFGTAVPFTSHVEPPSHQVIQVPQPLAPPQVPANHPNQLQNQQQLQVEHSPKPASPPKPSKITSVNLEELLKEHGIVPENSPIPSPDSNSPLMEDPVPSHMQPSNTVVPTPQLVTALQSQQVVLEQLSQSPQGHTSLPQIKLALTQDGSVIFQPHNAFSNTSQRVQQFIPSSQIHGRTANNVAPVILPTVTTSSVSVPVVATEPSTARNHSTLLARLNAAPAINVPDMSSLAIVTCIGGTATSSITTTTITTTTTTLVPLTVQSLNINSSNNASNYVVQRTSAISSTTPDKFFISEEEPSNHVTSVISSSVQQNRINHINSGFQTVVVSSDSSSRTSVQSTPKTVQSTFMVPASTTNSNTVQAEPEKIRNRENTVEIADNGAIVPSHTLPAFSANVPNHVFQNLQKEINELATMKYRTAEQQKSLQQLMSVSQKLIGTKGNKGCRAIQNQIHMKHDPEIEKLLTKAQKECHSLLSSEQSQQSQPQQQQQQQQQQLHQQQQQQQQQQAKASNVPCQQPIPAEKQNAANSKGVASHNLHLVNLLKQNTPHSTPVKLIAPATTSITTACDSTTTTSSATISSHQKMVNQTVNITQQRLQVPHQQQTPHPQQPPHPQSSKTQVETTQQQVAARISKPPQQAPPCPNVVPIKGPSPVKRVPTVPKPVLFSDQLIKDQNGVVSPDVKTPFLSKQDACSRLLRYHVYNSKVPSIEEIHKADETFDMVSVQLLEKVKRLKNKYQLLQLKESMRPCVTPDQVLMERLFIEDEQTSLQEDKAAVADGKALSLPPPPPSWLKLMNSRDSPPPPLSACEAAPSESKVEEPCASSEDYPEHPHELSDPHLQEDSDPPNYKDDDNLEAPVIDSCADIMVPRHDDNIERSPPTLKRIVIKPRELSESDSEEPVTNKRFKFNSACIKLTTSSCDWSGESTLCRPARPTSKGGEQKTNHKYPHAALTRESFHSDNRIDDVVSKIKLDISPMEMDMGDFEPGAEDLADFEPPVARTEESCDSLAYNRTNSEVKYEFDMLGCSTWDPDYVHHPPNDGDDPPDLDLSGLDGLEDHLEDGIPNGIGDESDVNSYVGYHIPKRQKRFPDVGPSGNCASDQVQSAIKSIMGAPAEHRSYFVPDDVEFLPMAKQSHNAHISDYGGSLDADMGATSGESDAALDEAVRSILL